MNVVAPYLEQKLDELVAEFPHIKARRGAGLLQGLEFDIPVGEVIVKAMDKGLILINAGANVLRFIPPLIIEKEDVDAMISILRAVL